MLLTRLANVLRSDRAKRVQEVLAYPYARLVKTPLNLARNRGKGGRRLEIGPGVERIPGFETINVVWSPHTDYVANASKRMPFPDGTFDLIYASHVLEHTPWYQLAATLEEWVRVLRPGAMIEIWVPNGLRIAQAFVDAENGSRNDIGNDGWYRFNPGKDPCVWQTAGSSPTGMGRGGNRAPTGTSACSPHGTSANSWRTPGCRTSSRWIRRRSGATITAGSTLA